MALQKCQMEPKEKKPASGSIFFYSHTDIKWINELIELECHAAKSFLG